MKFAAILPHTKLYGGVKRFFELGDALIKKGHEFIVFTPEGLTPEWYNGSVVTRKLNELCHDLQALFITETQYLEHLNNSQAKRKILYFVRPTDNLKILRKYPDVEVFANSTNSYEVAKSKYKIEAFKAFGGINTNRYYRKEISEKKGSEAFTILTYGRIVEKKKGTKLVVRACERLYKKGYKLRLILFDTPVNDKAKVEIEKFKTKVPFEFIVNHPVAENVTLYHKADIFVSGEKNAGYSNTSAEAMASGIPVIATVSGTRDFLIHNETGIVVSRWSRRIARAIAILIDDFQLRKQLASAGRKKIEEYSWDNLAARILKYLSN
jgi:glycosyltransferase involved in cell wall biosynthesis